MAVRNEIDAGVISVMEPTGFSAREQQRKRPSLSEDHLDRRHSLRDDGDEGAQGGERSDLPKGDVSGGRLGRLPPKQAIDRASSNLLQNGL